MKRRQAGFTLVELMVSLVLAAVTTGFAFSIYARSAQSSRAQARVAETQQALRAATELMSNELRQAGYLSSAINSAGGPLAGSAFISFDNENGDGTDSFRIVYADVNLLARVQRGGPNFHSAETRLESVAGWVDGDLGMAIRTNDPGRGQACLLKITNVQPGPSQVQHNPGASGSPWNQPGNSQCNNVQAGWNDGYTLFTKVVVRKYRIKPNDVRGVLQMSPSGGFVANDWQDIALGVIDLQLAVYVYTDPDGAGAAPGTYNWYSGANMTTALSPVSPATAYPLKVRLSLLAKSLAPTNSTTLEKTPDFVNTAMPLNNNDLGNRTGTTLPVSNPASPYHGDNLYRWTTVMIDLRNMGIGK